MTVAAPRSARGFTILELLLSMAIMVGITGVIFSLVDPSRGTYRAQPEVSDLQQRLRVGASFLKDDLVMAGAGSQTGGQTAGALMNYFAPIQPVRLGAINADPLLGIFYRDNAISIFYIPQGAPQATLTESMPQTSAELKLGTDASCTPAQGPLCKWKVGARVLIYDTEGAYDDMTITAVQEGAGGSNPDTVGHLQHNQSISGNDLSKKYQPGAQVAQIMQRTYYWNPDTLQLMYYDGASRDEAVVDNVVRVQFSYYGEPRPPILLPDNVHTTYGPRPPSLAAQNGGNGNNGASAWPPGENCVFMVNPANVSQRISRLPDLNPGSQGLVLLTRERLTDGPWCPDLNFPNRFDADVLRVRKVAVRMRVQVASAELRGPAAMLDGQGNPLYLHAGTGQNGRTLVPDQEIRFEVTPRNFNFGR
jgi:type II secretory pathway pseudopilin PulG